MRRLSLTLFFTLPSLWVLAQADFDSPVAYNSYIVKEQRKAVQKNLEYITFSVNSDDPRLIEEKRKEVLRQILGSMKKIEKMPPYKGDSKLKNEALDVLAEYRAVFEEDLKALAGAKSKHQDSFEAMEQYFKEQDAVEERVTKAAIRFNRAQALFVKKHDLTYGEGLGEDELTRHMESVIQLNKYARNIFLQYFKVSKAFAEMLDVLNDRKAGLLDRKRKLVMEEATEALTQLRSFGEFNGDHEYLDQTISITEYYQQLAENEFRVIVDIFRFNTELTQAHVKYINQVLQDYQANAELLIYNLHLANNALMQNNISAN